MPKKEIVKSILHTGNAALTEKWAIHRETE